MRVDRAGLSVVEAGADSITATTAKSKRKQERVIIAVLYVFSSLDGCHVSTLAFCLIKTKKSCVLLPVIKYRFSMTLFSTSGDGLGIYPVVTWLGVC
jgi:hypothetical protein